MAKAADFDGTANETEVIPPEKCRGKGRPSILSEKAYLWLLTINNPQDHGISLDQQDILERLKDDIAAGKIVYIIARMEQSLTTDENGKHTPHGHIAIRFAAQTRGGTVHKKFPMAALQNCNADTFSVRQYILKDPTGKWYKTHPEKIGERLPDSEANCWEWGQIPGSRKSKDNQSPKTLSEDIMRAIREGKNDADMHSWSSDATMSKMLLSSVPAPMFNSLRVVSPRCHALPMVTCAYALGVLCIVMMGSSSSLSKYLAFNARKIFSKYPAVLDVFTVSFIFVSSLSIFSISTHVIPSG